MFVLSEIPAVQQQQLRDLILVSQQKLAELTAPVILTPIYERKAYNYDTRELVDDYLPPDNRFARLGNFGCGNFNFDN